MQLSCRQKYDHLFNEIKMISQKADEDFNNKKHDSDRSFYNTMTRSGLVLLCGYFEGYLRDMAQEFINHINDCKVKAGCLPNAMIYECASIAMKGSANHNFDLFLDSLFSNNTINITGKTFSATDANPTVDVIDKMFARFGIDRVMDKLTTQDFPELNNIYITESQLDLKIKRKIEELTNNGHEVISLIENKWPPKTKRRRVGYLAVIDELLKKRNAIAHGEGLHNITTHELNEMTDKIQKLAHGLTTILEEKLYFITLTQKQLGP